MKKASLIILDNRQIANLTILAFSCLIGCGLIYGAASLLRLLPGSNRQPRASIPTMPAPISSPMSSTNPYLPTQNQQPSDAAGSTPQVTLLPPLSVALSGYAIMTGNTGGIMRWDFASNTISPIFLPPQNGVVASSTISPDGKTIVMAYAPPPEQNKPNLGYTNLYTMSADGTGKPTPILEGDHSREVYFTPIWSPDGQYIYYGHYVEPGPAVIGQTGFFMERMAYPSGQPQVLLQYGFVPHLSADGSKLVYISVDPNTYLNNLFVANADGSDTVSLIGPDVLWAIDAIAISPDGQTVIFSADSNGPTQSAAPWYYAWLGIRVAQAHAIPEDLYSVPITGGEPTRLTNIGIMGPSIAFSPDGQHVLVIGSTGVFVMNPDGSGQTKLLDQQVSGSVQWQP